MDRLLQPRRGVQRRSTRQLRLRKNQANLRRSQRARPGAEQTRLAHNALQRVLGDTMQVSFTVGFQSNGEADDVVNNVGVLVLPYDTTSMKTVKSLGSAFRAVAPMAAVTNFLTMGMSV